MHSYTCIYILLPTYIHQSEIEDVDRRRLLQSGCREVFLSWMRDLADQSDSDCEEMWSMETSNSSDSAVGKAHSLGANLFIETLLVTVDQVRVVICKL